MTNTSSRPADIRPKSKLAIVSFGLAVLAFVVAFVGVFRGPQMASGYWLIPPTVIALIAGYLGSHSLVIIERQREELSGDGLGVFAVMIGMLAFVTGAVGIFTNLVWPMM